MIVVFIMFSAPRVQKVGDTGDVDQPIRVSGQSGDLTTEGHQGIKHMMNEGVT